MKQKEEERTLKFSIMKAEMKNMGAKLGQLKTKSMEHALEFEKKQKDDEALKEKLAKENL